jgi:ornithine cyclodeaminase/alanine dehydrogenase-like protein (mu-crystallin family)
MMPCYSAFDDLTALKVISLYPDNKSRGLPTIIVHVLLFENGKLVAFMVTLKMPEKLDCF